MDNINVCVRIRPLNRREEKTGDGIGWIWQDQTVAQTTKDGTTVSEATFSFDHIQGPESETSELYETVAEPIIKGALEGINGTIFAYGQTSSGKTHTMQGNTESPGILPLAAQQIFDLIDADTERDYLIRVSYLEIYNEVLRDLVAEKPSTLRIHEDPTRGVFVGGLTEEIVTNADQVLEFMRKGEARRHVSATNMNDQSSRSHTLYRMMIESRARSSPSKTETPPKPVTTKRKGTRLKAPDSRRSISRRPARNESDQADESGIVRVSQLNLVDLAGSERVAHTGAAGQRLREGGHINKSLLTLGNVIGKLADQSDAGTSGHVPYRDSKLTRILQTCLGGNARTAIVCTITPAAFHVEESLSTLKFANRAKRIRNQPRVNEVLGDKAMVRRCQREIDELRRRLAEGNVEAAEARISALSEERDDAMLALQQLQTERVDKLNRLIAFISDAPTPPVPGADKSGRHALAKRRDTWGPRDIEALCNGDSDSEADAPLTRPHDGETIDLGAVMREANIEADALIADGAYQAPVRPMGGERDLDLYMLPQRVSSEIIGLRTRLATAESECDELRVRAINAARDAEQAAQSLRSDLAEQRSAVVAAQKAVNDAAAQRDALKTELETLTAAHGELQQAMQSSALAAAEATQAECDKLRAAGNKLASERDNLKSDLRAAQREAKAASSKIASTERDFDRLRERFAKLEACQQKSVDEAATAASRAAGAERELKHALDRIEELEADLGRARLASDSSVETEGALADLKKEYEVLSQRCDKYRRQLADTDDSVADANARAEALTTELVSVHQSLATLEAERDDLRAQHAALQQTANDDAELAAVKLAEARACMEADASQTAATIGQLRDTVARLTAELQTARQTATADAEKARAALQAEQQTLKEARAEHAAAADAAATRECQLRDELKTERANAAAAAAQAAEQLASTKAAAADDAQSQLEARELLEAELEVQREYSVAYERQLELSAEQAKAIDELQAVNAQQTDRLTEATALMDEMRARCDEAEADGTAKAVKLKKAGALEGRLRAEIDTMTAQNSSLRQELKQLKATVSDQTSKLQRAAKQVKQLKASIEKSQQETALERDRAEAAELRAKELGTDCADAAMRLQLGATHESTATRLRSRLEKQAKELAEARDLADSAEQRVAQVEAEHAAVQQQLEMRADTLQETVNMLEEQLQVRGTELATAMASDDVSHATSQSAEVVQLRQQVSKLKSQLAEKRDTAPRTPLSDVTKASVNAANAPSSSSKDSAAMTKQMLKMTVQQEALQTELAKAQEKYAKLRASLPQGHVAAVDDDDFVVLSKRASELEVLLASERTRRIKVQAKLKQVIERVSGGAPSSASKAKRVK